MPYVDQRVATVMSAVKAKQPVKGLLERLSAGDSVVVAEGYILELEKRGYLALGAYVPEVVLEHPDVVRMLHQEWIHAGSDVVLACTYFANQSQLELVGRAGDFERINKKALQIAREVADSTGTLMAGGICNTMIYTPNCSVTEAKITKMFKEQIEWAVEAGADYIVGETYHDLGEALIALHCIKTYGQGLPAVMSLAAPPTGRTFDGVDLVEACVRLEQAGADVVGLNCIRGPDSILPLISQVKQACKVPVCCLPVPVRTDFKRKAMHQLRDSRKGGYVCPTELDEFLCSRSHIRDFAREARDIGVQYIGLCCGNRAHYIREISEVYGRKPPASRYGLKQAQHLTSSEDQQRSYQKQHYISDLRDYPPEN